MQQKGFVSRLMMQAVTDVLDQQGRAALLPDAVISMILGQLTIQVTYEPLECKEVFVDKAPGDMRRFRLSSCIWNIRRIEPTVMAMDKPQNCIIVRNTVTAICKPANDCQTSMADKLLSIDAKHLSISGSITSTNIVMANWNRSMWQSVVSRAIRAIASDPFGSHFATAVVTVT
ncbi:hypothetical protein KIN20_006002 [Parelaphostrongylus tenuis]|uniref:Uncharacterized protein n=1 Tax=Parelaphostrongylus tenuis TaxID=148309 RepID=A0AAD5QJ18_PARTN|nr:hypothetical protein KIN20_006002 [Parelaphostrongylus tenuis]